MKVRSPSKTQSSGKGQKSKPFIIEIEKSKLQDYESGTTSPRKSTSMRVDFRFENSV